MLLELALRRFIKFGSLSVTFPNGVTKDFGTGGSPAASVKLKSPRIVRELFLNPALALGEGYMRGDLEPGPEGLFDLLDLLAVNSAAGRSHGLERLGDTLRWLTRRIDQLNRISRSRYNVAHHYDLDARLYSLMLDTDLQYSCAYFPKGTETLEEAQRAKKLHIAAKLHLDRPGYRVLDIGSGWGGMAIFLAKQYRARVTGLTLSQEQLSVARRRAKEAGVEDLVNFELLDYRNWQTPVDRIVSVGMFEHVGIGHYSTFFEMVQKTLNDNGVALIHAIGRSSGPGSTNPWIAKYIFPGGYSPALSEVLTAVEQSGLWSTDIEILRLHYAHTLRHWRNRFRKNRSQLAEIYDETFCRMFEFYLIGSELAFTRFDHMNWQLQLTKKVNTLPMSRDYMMDSSLPTPNAFPVVLADRIA